MLTFFRERNVSKNNKTHYLKHINDLKAFIEYSNNMQDVCKDVAEYNYVEENKILMVFDDLIADMINILRLF